MKRFISILIAAAILVGCGTFPAAADPLMTNPRYIQSAYIGGGTADPVDGGMDLGANGEAWFNGLFSFLDGFKVPTDKYGTFGTADEFNFVHDSGSDELEVEDADANVMFSVFDDGTAGILKLNSGGVHLDDDTYLKFGTGGDFVWDFDSGTSKLELKDSANILGSWEDSGTWGTLRTGNLVVGGNTAIDGLTGFAQGIISVGGGVLGGVVATDTSQAADNQSWAMLTQAGSFILTPVSDAIVPGTSTALTLTRTDGSTNTINMQSDTSFDITTGTMTIDATYINAPNGYLLLGVPDDTAAYLNLSGTAAGAGGYINFQGPGDNATWTNTYMGTADGGVFEFVRGSQNVYQVAEDGDTFTFKMPNLVAEGGIVNVGVNDTADGVLSVYGDNTFVGGMVKFFAGASADATDEYMAVTTDGAGYLVVEDDGGTDKFSVAPALNLVFTGLSTNLLVQGGEGTFGIDDDALGNLKIYGDTATSGSIISLYNAASEDTTANVYDIETDDDLKVKVDSTTVLTVQSDGSGVDVTGHTETDTLAITQGAVVSGTYTPTLTNVANTSARTAHVCQYMRVGNVVTVSGSLEATQTAATTWTRVLISLPVASALANLEELGGTGNCVTGTTVDVHCQILGEPSFNVAEFRYISDAAASTSREFTFSFTYQII